MPFIKADNYLQRILMDQGYRCIHSDAHSESWKSQDDDKEYLVTIYPKTQKSRTALKVNGAHIELSEIDLIELASNFIYYKTLITVMVSMTNEHTNLDVDDLKGKNMVQVHRAITEFCRVVGQAQDVATSLVSQMRLKLREISLEQVSLFSTIKK